MVCTGTKANLWNNYPACGGGKEMRAKFWGPGQALSPGQQGGGGSPGRLSGYGGNGHYGGSAKAEDEHTLKWMGSVLPGLLLTQALDSSNYFRLRRNTPAQGQRWMNGSVTRTLYSSHLEVTPCCTKDPAGQEVGRRVTRGCAGVRWHPMAPGTCASEILQLLCFSDPEEKVDEGLSVIVFLFPVGEWFAVMFQEGHLSCSLLGWPGWRQRNACFRAAGKTLSCPQKLMAHSSEGGSHFPKCLCTWHTGEGSLSESKSGWWIYWFLHLRELKGKKGVKLYSDTSMYKWVYPWKVCEARCQWGGRRGRGIQLRTLEAEDAKCRRKHQRL